MKPKVLAVSASLRNARWGHGTRELLESIKGIDEENELVAYLDGQAKVHLEQFVQAGREKGLSFDELYRNLRRLSGRNGLSNSEVGMGAALWAAHQIGCEIDYLPLSDYFKEDGSSENLDELKAQLLGADAMLLCTPVYFGDRSSLASDFVEFIRSDAELFGHLAGKPMAGIAVGAKRNGGQETTLIYQLMDMINIGMVGVGNDSESTSQYGGTLLGGDVGTAAKDAYGIKTAIGTGRRLARIALTLTTADPKLLRDKLRVMFWVLQDRAGFAMNHVQRLIKRAGPSIEATIVDATRTEIEVARCIACDVCPTHVGMDAEYRCIVRKKADLFASEHADLLDHDVIVPVGYSPVDRRGLVNAYQRFIERTRYLRRGDYLFTDVMVMPFILDELGANENLPIRMTTSLIRHHTVVGKPMVATIHKDAMLNMDGVDEDWAMLLDQARRLTVGRLQGAGMDPKIAYNPVGYVLSALKDKEASVVERRAVLHQDREVRQQQYAVSRLARSVDDVKASV